MAHVYYADKHPFYNQEHSEDRWAHQMGYVFTFMEFWNRYKIYRAFNWIPLTIANGFGSIAGKIALKLSKTYEYKLRKSYYVLYPEFATEKNFQRFRKAYSAYLGKLVFAFIGGLTLKKTPPHTDFARFENLSLLDRELSKNQGVIIPITHLGELTQAIWALINHPKKYTVATVVYVPHMGIYKFANHEYYSNVYFYASTKFRYISSYLENHLKKNHIVMIYYDFGHPGQFRVPFWFEKFPYLLHTPQSIFSLHERTGASILPCINLPDQVIGKTLMKFIDNQELMAFSHKYWNRSSHILHGYLSMKLNQIYAPYLRAYGHVWEQFLDFYKRISDNLTIASQSTYLEVYYLCFEKFHQIIQNSFEPERPDDELIKIFDKSYQKAGIIFNNPDHHFCTQEIELNLSAMSSVQEIINILQFLIEKFHNFGEKKVEDELYLIKRKITDFPYFQLYKKRT